MFRKTIWIVFAFMQVHSETLFSNRTDQFSDYCKYKELNYPDHTLYKFDVSCSSYCVPNYQEVEDISFYFLLGGCFVDFRSEIHNKDFFAAMNISLKEYESNLHTSKWNKFEMKLINTNNMYSINLNDLMIATVQTTLNSSILLIVRSDRLWIVNSVLEQDKIPLPLGYKEYISKLTTSETPPLLYSTNKPKSSEEEIQSEDDGKELTDFNKRFWWIYVVLAAIILIIITLVLFIIKWKQRKAQNETDVQHIMALMRNRPSATEHDTFLIRKFGLLNALDRQLSGGSAENTDETLPSSNESINYKNSEIKVAHNVFEEVDSHKAFTMDFR